MYEYDEKPTMYEQETMEYAKVSRDQRVALYLAKVMGWMCLGLFTTFVSCFLCLAVPSIFYTLISSTTIMYGIMFAQVGVVIAMGAAINRISAGTATVLFMVYAALTGVTFTVFTILFEMISILYVFGLTALIFVALSVYGFITKRDLTRVGTLAMFGLFGIIIGSLVNMFIGNSVMDLAITAIGIVIFIVLIAYDTQKIKGIYIQTIAQGYDEDSQQVRKLAIFGALTLYLDFINLFLKLLRLLGKRRR